MTMQKTAIGATIALASIGLFLTMLTAGVLTSSQSVQSNGSITAVNVGVYSDIGCAQNLTSIDWGVLPPGNSTSMMIYIKNTGNVPETLSMATSNWVPSNANTYLTLTWNRANYVLSPNTSVNATLTLTASSGAGALTTFSFNIIITGTQ